jgi:hypothetical protein
MFYLFVIWCGAAAAQNTDLYNRKLTPLEINLDEKDISKKYHVDFMTACYCNADAIFIYKEKKLLYTFDYCAQLHDKDNRRTKSKIVLITENGNSISIKTVSYPKEFTVWEFTRHDEILFDLKVTGAYAEEFRDHLKPTYTAPENEKKFTVEDCGDFQG